MDAEAQAEGLPTVERDLPSAVLYRDGRDEVFGIA